MRHRSRAWLRPLVVLLGLPVLVLAGCADRGPSSEVDDGSDSARDELVAPVFPDGGQVPVELVVEGLVFDLSNRPGDLNHWAAPSDEAGCAAERIVETVGDDRLVELGYRPGVSGASLNDLDLTDDERERIVDAVAECVDMVEAVAAMFYGDGRLDPQVATCLSEGLGDAAQLRPFVVAIVFGTAVDPFADDGALANELLVRSAICVPQDAFDWSDLELPGGGDVIDSDAPGGLPDSAFPDDRPDPTSTTTTAAP